MKNQHENYQQQKINSSLQQTVIVDPADTGETDELDPSFKNSRNATSGPKDKDDGHDNLDGEGIDEENQGANVTAIETNSNDRGLNHDQQDDLSLNTDEDDVV